MATAPVTRFNWPAAFVAYCNNCPLEEIAQVYGMEMNTLQLAIARDGWARLRATIPQAQEKALTTPNEGELKLRRLQENREKNLKVWADLRDDLVGVVEQLRNGKLRMEKLFFSAKTCMVVREEVEPTMGDRVNLATYARTIADGTYRALGDFEAQEKAGQDAKVGQTNSPSITIILPACISKARGDRSITEVQSEVIDLRDNQAQVTQMQPPHGSPDTQPTGEAPLACP